MIHFETIQDEYAISTDLGKLDVDAIYAYLSQSYWAAGRPREVIVKSLAHSLNFGLYHQEQMRQQQVGLVRVITDYATFAYVCDVYVLEAHRKQGLSKWLMSCVKAHPDLQGIRRWLLVTRDAHGLYAQFGFTPLENPSRWMAIFEPGNNKSQPSEPPTPKGES
jgi:GNAT superfamily N-acetyltransferase